MLEEIFANSYSYSAFDILVLAAVAGLAAARRYWVVLCVYVAGVLTSGVIQALMGKGGL